MVLGLYDREDRLCDRIGEVEEIVLRGEDMVGVVRNGVEGGVGDNVEAVGPVAGDVSGAAGADSSEPQLSTVL